MQLTGVDLYASAGYYITALEGSLDGVPFFADGLDTITIEIGEGTHHLDFWALSSYGDSSYHFIEDYYVDTQNPVISASLSGTPGDNNWFVSDTTLTVSFTDPAPASGVDFTRALSNGIEFSVANPVVFPEGVYNLQLDVRDFAGHTAQTLYNLLVDTTAPVVTANQPPVELAMEGITGGGYVNGSVVFTGTCGDATSGVNRIELSTDGTTLNSITPNLDGTWTLDWDSSMLPDSTYTPVISAVDNAGNRTDITMQPLTLDNSAPAMSITGGWYIWESGHLVVYDSRSGIKRIELSVRDEQNRWPAREWDFDTKKLEMDLQWDRKFGDGTIAPIGDYQVLLQAWDKLGNGRWISGRIYIPEAGATAEIPLQGILFGGEAEPTNTPLPDATEPAPVVGGSDAQTEATTIPTSTMIAVPISAGDEPSAVLASADTNDGEAPVNTTPLTDGILWGAAALAAGAAAAVVSARQLKETRAKEEAKIWEGIMEAIAARWDNYVAGLEVWNKAVAEAQAKHDKEVLEGKGKWLSKLYDSDGKAFTDLSDEEQKEFLSQNAGASEAVVEYFNEMTQQNAELSRLIASTGGSAISDLSKEQLDDFLDQGLGAKMAVQNYATAQLAAYQAAQKKASEYSNQVKAFHEGEEAGSKTTDKAKARVSPTSNVSGNWFTDNIIEPLKTPVANLLNAGSSVLGKMHDGAVKTIDWIDEHQTGTAAGIGLVVGAVVIGITIAAFGTITLPLIAAAACVSLVTAGTITFTGTMALNSYYGRDLSTRLLTNTFISGGVAFGTCYLGGLIFGGPLGVAIPAIGNTVTAWCLTHQAACSNVPAVMEALDKGEELYLEAKFGIQTITGNPNAAETLIELQLEKLDKGTPGNSVLLEGFHFLKKNIPDAMQYVQKYGFEMIPFLAKYGDEGMQFLDNFADEGVEFILKHLNDAPEAISLAIDYGRPAFKLLDTVDVTKARKLLENLDRTDIDALFTLSDDAIKQIADLDVSILNELNGNFAVYSVLGDDAVEYLVDGWTGTSGIWNTITATQPIYDGTVIPRSFEIVINDQKIWVHGNGTKHIYEEVAKQIKVTGIDPDYYSQILLYDFSEALNQATVNGIKYEEIITVGNWEFIFSAPRGEGLLPVVKHAQFNGWGN
ncbi:MAG: Ig-like domain repeat protein [Anaerolineaceae bacterium]|nr:Ig-like domain repeat protein [Anaerolineaceae bacterium]